MGCGIEFTQKGRISAKFSKVTASQLRVTAKAINQEVPLGALCLLLAILQKRSFQNEQPSHNDRTRKKGMQNVH